MHVTDTRPDRPRALGPDAGAMGRGDGDHDWFRAERCILLVNDADDFLDRVLEPDTSGNGGAS